MCLSSSVCLCKCFLETTRVCTNALTGACALIRIIMVIRFSSKFLKISGVGEFHFFILHYQNRSSILTALDALTFICFYMR